MKAGFSKEKVIYDPGKKGTGLLGYVDLTQKATRKETELYVRALVLVGELNNPVFSVCIETCFASAQLKADILKHFEKKSIDYKPISKNLMLHAQNTHSAPGGISSYLLHNLFSGGFNESFYNALLQACITSLEQAISKIKYANLILNVSQIDDEKHLAFNRSIGAYNQNRDVNPLDANQTNIAVNRWFKQLKIIDYDGVEMGVINWFGVHGNSVGPDQISICSDNKGYASSIFEKEKADVKGFTAIFAQEACGDISPNYHGNAFRWPRGKYEDGFKSAYYNGYLQYEKASELLQSSDVDIPVKGIIHSEHAFYDFGDYRVDERFSEGKQRYIGMPSLGFSMVKGNPIDTPGISGITAAFLYWWLKFSLFLNQIPILNRRKAILEQKKRKRIHGSKEILIALDKKMLAGFSNLSLLPQIEPFQGLLEMLKKSKRDSALRDVVWWPEIIELQYFRIGSLLIIAIPGDISTQAAFRLRKSIMDASDHSFIDVIINSYCNDYCGYICTPEEYDMQLYEGGFSVYGRETLAALQTAFCEMIIGSKKSAVKNKRPSYLEMDTLKKMI
jgi:neutral ceramidase